MGVHTDEADAALARAEASRDTLGFDAPGTQPDGLSPAAAMDRAVGVAIADALLALTFELRVKRGRG